MLTFQMLVRNFPVCSLALEHLRRWLLYNAWELSMDSPSPLQVLKASLQLWLATWKAWRSYTGLRVAWKWLWLLKWGKSMVLGWINTPSSSSRCRFSLSQQQLWATLFFILLGDSGSQEPSPGIRWVCVCHCFFFLYPWASMLWILRAKYLLSTRITEFVRSTGRRECDL